MFRPWKDLATNFRDVWLESLSTRQLAGCTLGFVSLKFGSGYTTYTALFPPSNFALVKLSPAGMSFSMGASKLGYGLSWFMVTPLEAVYLDHSAGWPGGLN